MAKRELKKEKKKKKESKKHIKRRCPFNTSIRVSI